MTGKHSAAAKVRSDWRETLQRLDREYPNASEEQLMALLLRELEIIRQGRKLT
jgi:hypothetical protein